MNIPDKSLYEITGDIKDINTLLVGREEIEALVRDAERWRKFLSTLTPKALAMICESMDAMQEKQS